MIVSAGRATHRGRETASSWPAPGRSSRRWRPGESDTAGVRLRPTRGAARL